MPDTFRVVGWVSYGVRFFCIVTRKRNCQNILRRHEMVERLYSQGQKARGKTPPLGVLCQVLLGVQVHYHERALYLKSTFLYLMLYDKKRL